jgi:hypothetical protein
VAAPVGPADDMRHTKSAAYAGNCAHVRDLSACRRAFSGTAAKSHLWR